MKRYIFSIFAVLLVFVSACATSPTNPSLPISIAQAKDELQMMSEHRVALRRPLVVLGGYNDPGLGAAVVANALRELFDSPEIISVSFLGCGSFDECRTAVIESVNEAFASEHDQTTVAVDVIGVSMGGLVARYAALPMEEHGQLNAVRIFTVATPHRGALWARFPALGRLHRDMRTGSDFLTSLEALENKSEMNYELIPYVRLGDGVVGEANAAPHGMTPWWVPAVPLEPAHIAAAMDHRILADIARRLRDEPPLAQWPPAPLPQ